MAQHGRVYKAHLTQAQIEQIALERNQIDNRYWPLIMKFGERRQIGFPMAISLENFNPPPSPPKPKLPGKLCDLVSTYAVELFNCEITQYPKEKRLEWGQELVEKTLTLLGNYIIEIETGLEGGLRYHATPGEILAAARKVLGARFQDLHRERDVVVEISGVGAVASTATLGLLPPPLTTVAEQLKALFNEAADKGIDVDVAMVAQELGITPKSVYRHLHDEAQPRKPHVEGYERVFSKALGQPVTLKRQRKVIAASASLKRSKKSQPR